MDSRDAYPVVQVIAGAFDNANISVTADRLADFLSHLHYCGWCIVPAPERAEETIASPQAEPDDGLSNLYVVNLKLGYAAHARRSDVAWIAARFAESAVAGNDMLIHAMSLDGARDTARSIKGGEVAGSKWVIRNAHGAEWTVRAYDEIPF